MSKTVTLPKIKLYGTLEYCEIIVEFNDSRMEPWNIKNIIVARGEYTVFMDKRIIDHVANSSMEIFTLAISRCATWSLIDLEIQNDRTHEQRIDDQIRVYSEDVAQITIDD